MLRRLIATIRALAEGVGRPTASSCSGDSVAAEKDAQRHFREREAIRNAHGTPTPSSEGQNASADSRRALVS
jgi:hypothetical protein